MSALPDIHDTTRDTEHEYAVQRLDSAMQRLDQLVLPTGAWKDDLTSVFASMRDRVERGEPQTISDLYLHQLAQTVVDTPIDPACPLCNEQVAWMPPPVNRWLCRDCAVYWTDRATPGTREYPMHDDTVPPLGNGDQ